MYQNNFQMRLQANGHLSKDNSLLSSAKEVSKPQNQMLSLCHCCLSKKDLRSMGKPYLYHGKFENYYKMLSNCFTAELSSSEGWICADCVRRLRAALSFRQCVEAAKKYFKSNPSIIITEDTHTSTANVKKSDTFNNIQPKNVLKDDMKNNVVENINIQPDNYSIDQQNDYEDIIFSAVEESSVKPEAVDISLSPQIDSESSSEDDDFLEYIKSTEEEPQHVYNRMEYDVGEQRTLPYVLDNTDRVCEICHQEFSFFGELLKHMPEHYPNHICDICGKICATRKSLIFHSKTHTDVRLDCQMCDKSFKNKSNLNTHVKVQHKGEKILFKCNLCGEILNTYNARIKHLAEKHGREDKAYKCIQCPSKYRLGSHLRAHVRRVHLQEKNHKCSECSLSFFTRKCLENHALKHSGERNFLCSVCNKSYSRKESLRHHMKSHEVEKQMFTMNPISQQVPIQYIADDNRYQMRPNYV